MLSLKKKGEYFMKKVHYIDKDGRNIEKKEGFSWPTFIILLFLFVVPGIIYAICKTSFMATRGVVRATKRQTKKKIKTKN